MSGGPIRDRSGLTLNKKNNLSNVKLNVSVAFDEHVVKNNNNNTCKTCILITLYFFISLLMWYKFEEKEETSPCIQVNIKSI